MILFSLIIISWIMEKSHFLRYTYTHLWLLYNKDIQKSSTMIGYGGYDYYGLALTLTTVEQSQLRTFWS